MSIVAKKVNLPLLESTGRSQTSDAGSGKTAKRARAKKPSIDVARARLGGRIMPEDEPPSGLAPGVLVTFPLGKAPPPDSAKVPVTGMRMTGVIVFASEVEVHVLLDGVHLRRFAPTDLLPHDGGSITIELERIAGDARLFGQLAEGQRVRYADETGELVEGKVFEKCRWGALVRRLDGAVIAVGFRKLWPAPTGSAA